MNTIESLIEAAERRKANLVQQGSVLIQEVQQAQTQINQINAMIQFENGKIEGLKELIEQNLESTEISNTVPANGVEAQDGAERVKKAT